MPRPNPKVLGPYRPRLKPRRVLITELETLGRGGDFILAGMLDEAGAFHTYTTPADLLAAFLTHRYRGATLLSHNLDYDLRYYLPVLEYLTGSGYSTRVTADGSGRVIAVRITRHKHTWNMADSFCLMPAPLVELGPLAGIEPLDIGISLGVIFDPDEPGHLPYLEHNLRLLLAAYRAHESAVAQEFGVPLGLTAGSTGMHAWQRTIPDRTIYYRQRPRVEAMARDAYHGALVYMRDSSVYCDVVKLDVNAMYAAAMRSGVPVRAGAYCRREHPEYPGIYRCKITPPRGLPVYFLPGRKADGRLCWPDEEFVGTLCSNVFAQARGLGYTIDVIEGYTFEGPEYPFNEFIGRCEALETQYKGLGLGQAVKFLRVSLYGKFGQRPKAMQYYITSEPDDYLTPFIATDGEWLENLYWEEVAVERAHQMPHWAAWITSAARVLLVDAIYGLGAGAVVYADTDSVVVPRAILPHPAVPVGVEYGKWKIEAEYDTFRAIDRKAYVGHTYSGEWDARHAGIPLDGLDPRAMLRIGAGESLPVWYDELPRAVYTAGGRPLVRRTRRLFNAPTTESSSGGAIMG